MRRTFFTTILIGVALTASPSALAQQQSNEPRVPTLTITAEGSVETAPDLATISLGVTTINENAVAAMAENAQHMNALIQALHRAGVASRDIQTSRLALRPNLRNRSNGEEPVVTGYSASNQVSVRARDLTALPHLIDDAINAGGNKFNGVRFSLNEPQTALDAARREAVVEARRRAELYADAAGLHVLRIVSMSEGVNRMASNDDIVVTGYRASDIGTFPTPIESGEIQTRALMTLVFELR